MVNVAGWIRRAFSGRELLFQNSQQGLEVEVFTVYLPGNDQPAFRGQLHEQHGSALLRPGSLAIHTNFILTLGLHISAHECQVSFWVAILHSPTLSY